VPNVNVGESGRPFYFYVGFTLTGFTTLRLVWTKPDGTEMERDNSASAVRVGTSTVFVTALSATLLANQYALYTIGTGSAGEIDQQGDWRVRLHYIVSTDTPVTHLISEYADSSDEPIVMTVEP
jgi:hypothetical protein